MSMPFREKAAWVTLCAMVAVSLMYWLHMPTPFEPHSPMRVIHAMGVSVIAYLLIEVLAWAVLYWRNPRDARTPRDEREKLIDLKAIRIAYYVLAAGSLTGIFLTLHVVNAGPVALGMAVFMAFMLSQIVKHAARIAFYRRGA
jgi:small-conductance mechanosensitive channel